MICTTRIIVRGIVSQRLATKKTTVGISFLRLLSVPSARDETVPRVNADLPCARSCIYSGVGEKRENEKGRERRRVGGRKRENGSGGPTDVL